MPLAWKALTAFSASDGTVREYHLAGMSYALHPPL